MPGQYPVDREETHPTWFGKVVNGCDPSVLDPAYIKQNLAAGVRAFATTICILEGFIDTCKAASLATLAAEQAGVRVLVSAEDIRDDGPLGIILALQNTSAFEGSLLLLDSLAQLGVRIVQLTYNEQNLVGSGCSEPSDDGLSRFGVKVLSRLQEVGTAVDLSHCGRQTARDAIDRSAGPILFTHSNCNVLCPNPRNRTDEEIKAVAATGGVIGLNAFPTFVDPAEANVAHLARHAAHIADISSSQHVSLGLDFINGRTLDWVASLSYDPTAYPSLDEWPESYATGIEGIGRIGNLAAALSDVGFSEDEIANIFFRNLCRVLAAVWPSASAAQTLPNESGPRTGRSM